ncbi:MAG: ABC transporter permease subunit [Betaproteobacteria bacterium]|nr:ABC transporter permease subunit [Betaproteobacteria bacterium]NBP10259.1 ABC transporter permease subunit [Betaproteobacteria bacterium]NBP60927.1 ABC transporter permease subunit [Betaproteobacteria bacterium]NBT65675.1 ABC transporter permease subunit [Betaproteobacteria bacterium]NCU97169.1 ABC transporter permease subunit [Betaproteobacteria bacterium]
MIAPRAAPPRTSSWSWKSEAFRSKIFQGFFVLVLIAVAAYLIHNTTDNMRLRGIQSGYGFLIQPAGFDIGETMFAYDSGDPYWKAVLVGLSNTVRVALLGIILATIIGTAVGIGRFSRNLLLRVLCQAYVEFFRNVPVLLQLLMWYLLLTEFLPAPNEPWVFGGGFYLSKGGVSFPLPQWALGHGTALIGFLAGLIAVYRWRQRQFARFEATGQTPKLLLPAFGFLVGGTLAGWLLGGAPTALRYPEMGTFAIDGGGALTPEFLAVLIGLTLYTAGFIAEVVRAGIQAVPRGQGEAAQSLGLSPGQEMRLVLLPQALRVIIPPLTSQYLNLTKNSSLAVAIGYPDVVSILNTSINQTGRAVECISIIMIVYLTTSLSTSALMNWYNARAAIQER